jgi:hypothetical protein
VKGNKKLLVVVALLLLLTLTFTSYAIYKSSYAGNANVNAAKWNVSFAAGQTTVTNNFVLTFDATDCPGNTHTASGVIAPGAYCEKTITVDAGDTQVDVKVEATADQSNITVGGSAVSSDANDFTATATVAASGGIITYGNATRTTTVTVRIEWDDEDDSSANPADVVNGADTVLAGQTITVPVTLTAKQVVATNP